MSATIARVLRILFLVAHPRRILVTISAIIIALFYVWFAAVRAVPGVRRRKLAWREAWRRRERRRPDAR